MAIRIKILPLTCKFILFKLKLNITTTYIIKIKILRQIFEI